MEDLLII